LWNEPKDKFVWYALLKKAKSMEKEQMEDFHKWMVKNDTRKLAEKYFHFTDSDMLEQYYKETYGGQD
jgi:hypothetical protein